MYGVLLFTVLYLLAHPVYSKQPHIVVILADDLGWNDVGFHGSNQIPTPNIDALAYSGVILNRHYVLPTCTPSRTALLTGMNPIRTGMQGFPMKAGETRGIPLDVKLLPEYLKDLNYATHMVGKWHLGYHTKEYLPNRRGFDSFFGYYNGYIEYFKYGLIEPKRVLGSRDLFYGYDLHHNEVDDVFVEYQGEYATRVFTDRAVDVIQDHDADKPLFLYLSHLAVHCGSSEGSGLEVPKDMDVNKTFPHLQDYERRQFAGVLTELDASVGRVVSALQEAHMLQDTIIVFMADNGAQPVSIHMQPNWGSNYPLRGGKFTLFEGGVRGTALVWSSKLPQGIVSNELIHMTDWLPTLYGAAGGSVAALPRRIDGKDMWSAFFIDDKHSQRKRDILLNIDEMEGTQGIIMDSRWKIVKGGMRNYAQYDRHLGKVAVNGSEPQFHFEAIRSSSAGAAILSLPSYTLNETKISKLRTRASVRCECLRAEPQFGYVNGSHEYHCRHYCVYDLLKDPCECGSGLGGSEGVRLRGVKKLREYQKHVAPQTNTAVDPHADPANFGGVWMPWLDSHVHNSCSTVFSSPISTFLIVISYAYLNLSIIFI